MDAHYGADIASQVSTTRSHSEVFRRSESVSIDHEVAIVLIYGRRLGPVTGIEELW
jgi:hypothetical protein